MRQTHGCGLTVAGALLSCGAALLWPRLETGTPKYVALAASSPVKNYKTWFRVTPKPVYLLPMTAMLCRMPTPAEVKNDLDNPHLRKYFTVYVNRIGKKAMLARKVSKFPVGTVIVKEKLVSEKSRKPELLTVMVKHQAGYDRARGDWEYMVVDGSGAKVQGAGKIAVCQGCHASQKAGDYVYRSYMDS